MNLETFQKPQPRVSNSLGHRQPLSSHELWHSTSSLVILSCMMSQETRAWAVVEALPVAVFLAWENLLSSTFLNIPIFFVQLCQTIPGIYYESQEVPPACAFPYAS